MSGGGSWRNHPVTFCRINSLSACTRSLWQPIFCIYKKITASHLWRIYAWKIQMYYFITLVQQVKYSISLLNDVWSYILQG